MLFELLLKKLEDFLLFIKLDLVDRVILDHFSQSLYSSVNQDDFFVLYFSFFQDLEQIV